MFPIHFVEQYSYSCKVSRQANFENLTTDDKMMGLLGSSQLCVASNIPLYLYVLLWPETRRNDIKGQVISKGFFGVFQILPKKKTKTCHIVYSKNKYVHLFVRRINSLTICFSKLIDLLEEWKMNKQNKLNKTVARSNHCSIVIHYSGMYISR